jgi:hypothetical protein
MIFEKDIMRKLMDHATPEMLKEFAQIEFHYGLSDDIVDRILNPEIESKPKEDQFMHHISMNVEYVLSNKGQNWFEKLDFDLKKGRLKLMGTHGLGKNFSLFVKYLFQAYGEHFDCPLIEETLLEDAVLLSFRVDKKLDVKN